MKLVNAAIGFTVGMTSAAIVCSFFDSELAFRNLGIGLFFIWGFVLTNANDFPLSHSANPSPSPSPRVETSSAT